MTTIVPRGMPDAVAETIAWEMVEQAQRHAARMHGSRRDVGLPDRRPAWPDTHVPFADGGYVLAH